LVSLWRNLAGANRVEKELADEVQAYLDLLVDEKINEGMAPDEARRAALVEMGGVEQLKEGVREVRMGSALETLVQDLRFGARMFVKRPGFTSIVVLTIALGVGANSAIFSVVNALLLRPLPVDESDRLVWVWGKFSMGDRASVSPADFLDFRAQNDVFEHFAAYAGTKHNLSGDFEPERLTGAMVSADFFDTLRVAPVLGRGFLLEEEQEREPQVVMLSHGLWQRRYGGDAGIVGQTIVVDGRSVSVVGIMPAGFAFPGRVDLWVPVPLLADEMGARAAHFLRPIARLNPGVSLSQAQAGMDAIAARLEEQYPASNTGWSLRLEPLHDVVVGDIRLALLVIAGAVGLVLLIACANIANLMLARASSRQPEITIRAAIGASRLRIVRQLLTESALLVLLGGALGLLLATWGAQLLATQLPEGVVAGIPGRLDIGIDARVLGFTAAVSLLTGLVFGAIPAIHASRPDLTDALKQGGRGASEGVHRNRLRGALVVAEIAGSVVLLVGAGLLVKSFMRLRDVDPGFDARNVLAMRIELSSSKYYEAVPRAAYFDEALRRVGSVPGIESVGTIDALPLVRGQGGDAYFTIPGRPFQNPNDKLVADFRRISAGYFRTMGIPVLAGRSFEEREARENAPVVIINEAMARRYFPDTDPIGQRLDIEWMKVVPSEIVGVVGDVRQYGLDKESSAEMYVPTLEAGFSNLVVRTSGDPVALVSAVRRELASVDKDQPITSVNAMAHFVEASTDSSEFNMVLLGAFAGVALLLAGMGIYGVTSYMVTQRTHEIGVRMALGARRADVLVLVLRRGLLLTIGGTVLGLALAFALSRFLASLLYGVSATDGVTFGAVSALLTFVAMVACYVPARRAATVDPIVALRTE
jgi:putative ABC transport system permease protein